MDTNCDSFLFSLFGWEARKWEVNIPAFSAGPGEWKSARCALGTAFGTSAANINVTTKDIELKL